jgi:hypothetical protein
LALGPILHPSEFQAGAEKAQEVLAHARAQDGTRSHWAGESVSLTDDELARHADRVINRLCKWRAHYTGWMLGTRPSTDPQAQATRDVFERLILLRCEMTALTGLLIEKGVFNARQLTEHMVDEAEKLSADYAKRWPGCQASDDGMHYKLPEAAESMHGWLP